MGMYLMPAFMFPFLIVATIHAERVEVIANVTIANILKSDGLTPTWEKLIAMALPEEAGTFIVEIMLSITIKSWLESANKNGAAAIEANEMNIAYVVTEAAISFCIVFDS